MEWPSDKTITVIIRQDDKVFAKYKISNTVLTLKGEIGAFDDTENKKPKLTVIANAASGYVFKLNGLPYGNSYTVTEEAIEGYQSPKYYLGAIQQTGASKIGDGGIIYNDQVVYALPNTGGPGTTLIYLFGMLITGLAITGMVARKRKSAI